MSGHGNENSSASNRPEYSGTHDNGVRTRSKVLSDTTEEKRRNIEVLAKTLERVIQSAKGLNELSNVDNALTNLREDEKEV